MISNSNRALESKRPDTVRPSEGSTKDNRWKDLAEQASREQDPEKLIELVKELCVALDGEAKPPAKTTDAKESVEKPNRIQGTE